MLRGGLAVGEQTGRLEDDVDAEVLPRQLRRIAHGEHLELLAVDADAIVPGFDPGVQVAEHRVVLEQMGERMRAGDVVDGDEIDVLGAQCGAHDVATDPTEAVDPDLYRHAKPPAKRFILQ